MTIEEQCKLANSCKIPTKSISSFKIVFKQIQERPWVQMFVWLSRETVYINTAARPDAKIDVLLM